jgi:hypothetical protein
MDIPTTKLKPGLLLSPGFYKDFWTESIEKVFTEKQILSQPFKPYRELWVGTPIAALYSKLHNGHYFIEMPSDEPPDVNIVRFLPTSSPSGRKGHRIERLATEVVRCNLDRGETIMGQISIKNKPEYQDLALAVYVFGGGETDNWEELHKELNNMKVYLSEIKLVGKVEATKKIKLPQGSFLIANIYPELTQHLIHSDDEAAFFHAPMLREGQKAFNTTLHESGMLKLVPPI